MANGALHTFTSHIEGKNATVTIYPDRLEWDRPRSASGGKLMLGAMTMGLSLAATGVNKKGSGSSEVIPIRSITSVSTKRDGFSNTLVHVNTGGGVMSFRVAHKEADHIKAILNDLILRGPEPVVVQIAAPATAPAPISQTTLDVSEQLKQVAALHDSGILTDEEFATKKAELLARL